MATRTDELSLSRDWDYLRQIRNTLQELHGAGALAHELIQNADDAKAKELAFRFTSEALEVEDSAGFEVCYAWQEPDCPLKDERGAPCDLHAFNKLGAGTKADDPDSTGAFGVGFLAAYQVTDRPEVLTAGIHLIVDEENRVSRVCPGGCGVEHRTRGTLIVLPWAKRATKLRKELQEEPITSSDRRRLQREFLEAIPRAMIFLRHVRDIKLETVDESHAFRWSKRGRQLTVTGPGEPKRWTIFEGSFDDEADRLRDRHPQIGKRHARVRVAVQPGHAADGRIFATLPTQIPTGLPLHLDAAFYPKQDRKGIKLDETFQAEWNAAAVAAVARLLASEVEDVAHQLGAKPFWSLVAGAHDLSNQNSAESRALIPIWDALREVIPKSRVMWTGSGEWEVVKDTVLPPRAKDQARLLEGLGVATVSAEITRMVPKQALGIRSISLEQLIDALEEAQSGYRQSGFPPAWRAKARREALHRLLSNLAAKEKIDRDSDLARRIRLLEIWESIDGEPRSFQAAYLADRRTLAAFSELQGAPFVEWSSRRSKALRSIADVYGVEEAVSDLDGDSLSELDETQLRRIRQWLNRRVRELDEDDLERLKDVPLFATTAGGRASARSMVRTGSRFKDTLGLASVLRTRDLEGIEAIANALGIRQLNFSSYVVDHVAPAVRAGELDDRQCRDFLGICARNIDALDRDKGLMALLGELEFLPCRNGELHSPREAYFDGKWVRDVLGSEAPIIAARIPRSSGVGSLLSSLGVKPEPRPEDVTERVMQNPTRPNSAGLAVIRAVLDFMSKHPRKVADDEGYEPLRSSAWLPASGRSDRWSEPGELFLTRDRRLFATAGTFVAVSPARERRCADALSALGVNEGPSVALVVRHVSNLAEEGKPPTPTILRWLNARSSDSALEELRDVEFLPDAGGSLFAPGEIFRLKHELEPWLPVLTIDGARPLKLLDALGVSSVPSAQDAVRVLAAVAEELGEGQMPDKGTRFVVRAAWRLVSQDPDCDIGPLCDAATVLGANDRLRRPSDVLIDDSPGISQKLGPSVAEILIPSDRETEVGLERAGVARLSASLRAKVVGVRHGTPEPEIERHILDRLGPLARVVRSGGHDPSRLFAVLGDLDVRSLSPLALRYSLDGHPEATESAPVEVTSHMDKELLFVSRHNGSPPWQAIASTLREALLPGGDQNAAATIGLVLEARDSLAADAKLDDYGFRKLTRSQIEELREEAARREAAREAEPETGDDAGEEGAEEGEEPERELPEDKEAEEDLGADEDISGDGAAGDVEDRGSEGREAGKSDDGSEVGGLGGAGGDTEQDGRDGERGSSRKGKGGQRGPGSGRRLRTVVYVDGSDEVDPSTTQDGRGRTQMGEDGVDRVVEELRRRVAEDGYEVEKMPDKQKGYDVRVKGVGGQTLNWVEVKSTEGKWNETGVKLSAPQFELALKKGERYWLYVVEYLYEPEALIWPIQDPARRANHFMYDAGWQDLAEDRVRVPGARRRRQ